MMFWPECGNAIWIWTLRSISVRRVSSGLPSRRTLSVTASPARPRRPVSRTATSISRDWPTMPNLGALSTSMRRSNSSGRPVSSACTGASKPSAAADFGTSCTWPSVIMMTPDRRSGGTLASARLRSANRLVPEGPSPVGLEESTHFTSSPGSLPSLTSRSDLMAAVCSGRPRDGLARALVGDDDGDVGEALALLLAQRWIGERGQQGGESQRAQRGAARAPQQQCGDQNDRERGRTPEQGGRAASARCRSTSSLQLCPIARAARAAPARAPDRPCSCRSAHT